MKKRWILLILPLLVALMQKALRLKPERHDFERQLENRSLRLHRHMNATGG